MKDVLALRLYTRVARLGGFSAAAREAGLAQSQVSRMIADLEAGLGTQLLSRTTRAVVPTEAGLLYLSRVEPILAALEDAGNSIRETGELRGQLRIGMPTTMGIRVVMPRLPIFAERHPHLHIEMLLDDRWQDMVREAVDVGIRVGILPEGSGTAKCIGEMQRVVVASPAYLAAHGIPLYPNNLTKHRIVGGPVSAQSQAWRFNRDGESVLVDVRPHISTNDTAGALAAAASGLGITMTTSWACRDELAGGTLVSLLAEWTTAALPVHAYYPLGRATRIAARAFVDFLSADLLRNPQ